MYPSISSITKYSMRLRGGCLLTMTLNDILITVEGDCKCIQYNLSCMRNLLNKLDRSWMTCAIIFVLYEAKFIALDNREALMSTNMVILSDRIKRYLFILQFSFEVTAFFYRTYAAQIKCSSGLILVA
jgi:hypothetical protein